MIASGVVPWLALQLRGGLSSVARDLLLDLTRPLAPVKIVWDTSLELDRLVSELQRVNLSMQNQHTEAIWPWNTAQLKRRLRPDLPGCFGGAGGFACETGLW